MLTEQSYLAWVDAYMKGYTLERPTPEPVKALMRRLAYAEEEADAIEEQMKRDLANDAWVAEMEAEDRRREQNDNAVKTEKETESLNNTFKEKR